MRLDREGLFTGLSLLYGVDKREYPAWEYTAHLVGGDLGGGYGFDLWQTRLNLKLAFTFAHIWQAFDTGDRKTGWQYHPKGGFSVLLPRKGRFFAEIFAELGPLYSPGSGLDAESSWRIAGGAGAMFYHRFL